MWVTVRGCRLDNYLISVITNSNNPILSMFADASRYNKSHVGQVVECTEAPPYHFLSWMDRIGRIVILLPSVLLAFGTSKGSETLW